jgi:hypothetical protein
VHLIEQNDTATVIADQLADVEESKFDRELLNILKFLRRGLTFEAPRWLQAVDRLQRVLLPQMGIAPGDYSAYISRILDAVLARLADLNADDPALGLVLFERRLVRAAQDDLVIPAA